MCTNESKSAKTCCNPCLFTNVLNTSTAFIHETWDSLEWHNHKNKQRPCSSGLICIVPLRLEEKKKVQSHLFSHRLGAAEVVGPWWDCTHEQELAFGNKGDIGCLLILSQPAQCRRLFLANCQGILCLSKVFCCLWSRPTLIWDSCKPSQIGGKRSVWDSWEMLHSGPFPLCSSSCF